MEVVVRSELVKVLGSALTDIVITNAPDWTSRIMQMAKDKLIEANPETSLEVNTWLPLFPGFYSTEFDARYGVIVQEQAKQVLSRLGIDTELFFPDSDIDFFRFGSCDYRALQEDCIGAMVTMVSGTLQSAVRSFGFPISGCDYKGTLDVSPGLRNDMGPISIKVSSERVMANWLFDTLCSVTSEYTYSFGRYINERYSSKVGYDTSRTLAEFHLDILLGRLDPTQYGVVLEFLCEYMFGLSRFDLFRARMSVEDSSYVSLNPDAKWPREDYVHEFKSYLLESQRKWESYCQLVSSRDSRIRQLQALERNKNERFKHLINGGKPYES